MGKHKLGGMVGGMCEEAGIGERKTNHSLRVTGATSLYNGGVPEREIQQRTGHRSLEALRKYERTGEQQHKAVSSMLSSAVDLPYSSHLSSVCDTSTQSSHTPQMHTSVLYPHTRVSSQSVMNQYSVQCPPGVSLQSLFHAGSGTLNISPQGNFVVNVQFGNRPQSDFSCDEFDDIVKDAAFDEF